MRSIFMGTISAGRYPGILPDDTRPIPLPVVPSNRIWSQELLKTYLEIYHLALDDDGTAHFVIDFEVSRLGGKNKSKEQSISLYFEFDSPNSTSIESFEIDISSLKPATYQLLVTVTDRVTRQTEKRSSEFEILDRDAP
ncbi:hypothetical protein MJD09_20775 [bacterium]|nr:hypothetical protein [bacterium]